MAFSWTGELLWILLAKKTKTKQALQDHRVSEFLFLSFILIMWLSHTGYSTVPSYLDKN